MITVESYLTHPGAISSTTMMVNVTDPTPGQTTIFPSTGWAPADTMNML